MADNIFDATLDVDNDVKVNNFDWSHANNLTTQIGRITPIFCDLVPAKTSFRVNPRFGLQFMPMVFPIQTRMKARISFFRYPLRALWKDYKDFIGNFRDGLEEPYINFNTETRLKKMASTGSLGDYLGLPTTIIGKYGTSEQLLAASESLCTRDGNLPQPHVLSSSVKSLPDEDDFVDWNSGARFSSYQNAGKQTSVINTDVVCLPFRLPKPVSTFSIRLTGLTSSNSNFNDNAKCVVLGYKNAASKPVAFAASSSTDTDTPEFVFNESDSISFILIVTRVVYLGMSTGSIANGVCPVAGSYPVPYVDYSSDGVNDITLSTSPWYNSSSANKNEQQKILAYGFRAYEGIYNSFYRDNRNNPYYLNGEVQYNTWIPNDKGGEDNELYELRYANWEKDFLTTAVQSPQQGNAPLVGITTYTQTVDNHDGTKTELVKTAIVDEDGKKYGLSFKSSSDGLEGVEYVELDNGTAVRQARSLYDLATSGISIPDLRMVNCYQKFLELNMRKGYSYKDIVEGRFAVKVRYADLLLPEFFGGVSRDIDVNSVTQTVDQNVQGQTNDYDKALGSQAGLAGVRGEANANIECFCDEESIIMGVLVVTPLPVYTQLLPKHFTYRGLMEHYQPEFNLIGFQPIKYNEVCPIQAYNADKKSLTETFGYNRPWYEYAQKYDVAHGLFRTDLSNFLMHRVFNQKPELAQSFLTVDPEQVTDVFAVTETTDKIYGQIWFDITCKLPIARVAIPRLD